MTASTIKGEVVNGGESDVTDSSSNLASPSTSGAVTSRNKDEVLANVTAVDEDDSVHIHPSLNLLKACDDGQEVDSSVTVDVSTLYSS